MNVNHDHDLSAADGAVSDAEPLLEISELEKYFPVNEGLLASIVGETNHVKAVDGVSLTLAERETFGLVGESGCGKSTLARTLLRLEKPTGGSITYRGRDLTELSNRALRPFRSEIQFIHQDPSSSLNPRKQIGKILRRPLELHRDLDKEEQDAEVRSLLDRVGLDPGMRHRYPHELSGGQKQRVEIARAVSVNPTFIVADEPTSALDVTVQAQILELITEIQDEYDLTLVFISHDLRTIRYLTDRVGVMYLGEMVEVAPTETIFENPKHPYTQSLLSAVPEIGKGGSEKIRLEGQPPDPINPPSGCRFHTRCPLAQEACAAVKPEPAVESSEHQYLCHFTNPNTRTGTVGGPTGVAPDQLRGTVPEDQDD
ncbi:ABC transporter ATP-binding protein [Natronorubrum halophilum]|uniref:ABC transporter ATP-binding protein n=1 Tax=Natronorubrum halophilum TaxID=1702106 RepID=UPI000EF758FC|nr:ABC transporter ATP-binding protein [Natronorubrum halophilum]